MGTQVQCSRQLHRMREKADWPKDEVFLALGPVVNLSLNTRSATPPSHGRGGAGPRTAGPRARQAHMGAAGQGMVARAGDAPPFRRC